MKLIFFSNEHCRMDNEMIGSLYLVVCCLPDDQLSKKTTNHQH